MKEGIKGFFFVFEIFDSGISLDRKIRQVFFGVDGFKWRFLGPSIKPGSDYGSDRTPDRIALAFSLSVQKNYFEKSGFVIINFMYWEFHM